MDLVDAKEAKDDAASFNTKVINLINDIKANIADKTKSGDDAAREIEKSLSQYAGLAEQWTEAGDQF